MVSICAGAIWRDDEAPVSIISARWLHDCRNWLPNGANGKMPAIATYPNATEPPRLFCLLADMKRRFITLDAMRGVAAIFVVAYHFSTLRGAPELPFSVLAVDLFFLLSGFVLSYSYSDKLAAGMTPGQFFKRRLIRLYPLYFLGLLFGASIVLRDVLRAKAHAPHTGTFITQTVSELLLLPSPTWHVSPFTFPLLIPGWSLFFELYVANAIFSVVGAKRVIAIPLAVTAGIILLLTMPYFMAVGGGTYWNDFIGGFPRVIFTFFAGVLLQQVHKTRPPKLRVPSWLVLVALTAAMLPTFNGGAMLAYEMACVFVLFPAFIFWGAEAMEPKGMLGSLLGDSSYAIYVLHAPFLILFGRILANAGIYPGYRLEAAFIVAIGIIAYSFHRIYDQPVRTMLSRKWRSVQVA